jgi:hypothetical protein
VPGKAGKFVIAPQIIVLLTSGIQVENNQPIACVKEMSKSIPEERASETVLFSASVFG